MKILIDLLSKRPVGALLVLCIFALHYLNCLPFMGNVRQYNFETVATQISYFIYAQESWTFPIGKIQSLAFPFETANVGNVGAIPLFAILFKLFTKISTYFQDYDYVVLVDLISCFTTALFAQKILARVGINKLPLVIIGALLTGTSMLIIHRSIWMQPFCIVAIPIYTAWMYYMISFLERKEINWLKDLISALIFPISAILDGYAFFGIMLATSTLVFRELYEAYFGGSKSSNLRVMRLIALIATGLFLSYSTLYIVGMYPLPKVNHVFTSYDFGMGGRYHVADLLSSFIPMGDSSSTTLPTSLLGLGNYFPLSSNILDGGQHEGISYVGTSVILIWILYLFYLIQSFLQRSNLKNMAPNYKLILMSSWSKIGIAAITVFIFSLGYELHILGKSFPDFNLMPAAWLSDRFPSLYNIRAPGRLASLFSLFIILESIRKLSFLIDILKIKYHFSKLKINLFLFLIVLIHLFEIQSFLHPIKVQPAHSIGGGVFSSQEIIKIRNLSFDYDLIFFAPSVRVASVEWGAEAFSFHYYSRLKSNLYYLARTDPKHDQRMARDLQLIESGKWMLLQEEYQEKILIVIPINTANKLRSLVEKDFEETIVGPVSVWSKKN